MSSSSSHHLLIDDIDHYLAVLSKMYRNEGETRKLEIIVNAQVKTQGDWTYDGWNGGQYGHALYLSLPEALYLACVKIRSTLQNSIRDDLNQISDIQDEHIAEVFIELERADDADWRQESGLLRTTQRLVTAEAVNRIWTTGFRVFLSHKTEVKKKTAELKDKLVHSGSQPLLRTRTFSLLKSGKMRSKMR